jgi:hypothetical protein
MRRPISADGVGGRTTQRPAPPCFDDQQPIAALVVEIPGTGELPAEITSY